MLFNSHELPFVFLPLAFLGVLPAARLDCQGNRGYGFPTSFRQFL
jgi:hypothetical protein